MKKDPAAEAETNRREHRRSSKRSEEVKSRSPRRSPRPAGRGKQRVGTREERVRGHNAQEKKNPERENPKRSSTPEASRPYMPGYGILDAIEGRGLLPWSWAAERLSGSHNYWVATTRPDGRPHAAAVWGVWVDDMFYFSTGERSRKARNLARNPRCVVCAERTDKAVIVEGIASKLRSSSIPKRVLSEYSRKYKSELDPKLGPAYVVRPRVAFGFIEAADEFSGAATRWTFPST